MPLGGWTCRKLAPVLGVSEQKVTQAFDPAVRKIARAMRADASATLLAIVQGIVELETDEASPAEIELRRRIQTGRVNRSEVGQHVG